MAPKELPFDLRYNFELLSLTVLKNLDYFYFCINKYWYSESFVLLLKQMLDHIRWYEKRLKLLSDNSHLFDISDSIKGNGFRSFDIIFERLFLKCYHFLKDLSTAREKMLFLATSYLQYLHSYVNILENLKSGLNFLLRLMEENTSGHPVSLSKHLTIQELLKDYGYFDQKEFYGRCQGFYFCSSMEKTLWGVSVIMASFSDLYQNSGGPLSRAIFSIINGIKYCLYPDLRSQQIVNVAQNSSVEFLKAFWSLSEVHFMKELPKWICPKLDVLESIWVPNEPITVKTENLKTVVIPAPSSHIPSSPIRCLLMSYVHRKGQPGTNRRKFANDDQSPYLLFHCHGGGFISQNPECHEIYLRHWAKDLNIPILSVDYSLAPSAPFPRALEEVLLAYVWARKNCHKLGWTGEKICFAGDSAGGNILMGIIIKTISLKIQKPDAILCAYTPLILDIVPSPSRILCWLDPLLPLGFMFSCLDSYVGAMHTGNDEYMQTNDETIPRKRKLSSITEIIDSSYVFLQENDWIEIEANAPEDKGNNGNIGNNVLLMDSNEFEGNSESLLEPYSDNSSYLKLTKYLNQFLSHSHREPSSCKTEDYNEHLLYSFPQDLVYGIKQKCASIVFSAFDKTFRFIEEHNLYKTFVSSFVSPILSKQSLKTVPLQDEAKEPPLFEKMKRLKVLVSNPYISPLCISDDVLREMPKIYFLSLNFDPCLDDSITFAKRMTSVGKPVVLDVLDGLPHGFLNFLPFSQEAHKGSDTCIKRIKEALNIQE